jgi:hypothetical protein
VSELDTLARAQVGLAVARKDGETAWLWIDLLEAADPASPALEPLRRLAGPRPGPPGV